MSNQPQSLLFYTSRTARDNYFFCPRYRYLSNHFGPSGYGIQPQRQSIPLATGGRVHDVFKPILEWVQEHDALPPDEVVLKAALAAVDQYTTDVAAKGLSYWSDDDQQYQRMVQENSHLIAGLPMVWCKYILPRLLEDWKIVLVEPREVSVYKCTCELGDGIPHASDHVARGCQGLAIMTGPDFIAQHRRSDSYRYDEFKTRNAPLTDAWAESYETRVQIQLGTLGVEQKYGIEIHEVYLHGLCKGQYRQSKELGEYQDSRLCWAWKRPTAPPMTVDEWAYEYERWDEQEGRTKRLGKGYERAWIGDFPGGLPAWIDTLPDYTLARMLRTVGPLPRNPVAKQNALEGWIELESQIQSSLEELYLWLSQNDFNWAHPEFQSWLNKFFPQSWDCQRFGSRYPCAMKKICHHEPGWQDPFTIGYVNRRPHHPSELAQALERGCLVPDEDYEEEDPQ